MAGNPSLAGMDDAGLEPWRKFFSGVDVFSVIAHAILVAATDMPQEFRRRRDSIVEQIFIAPAVVPDLGRAATGDGPSAIAKHVLENGGNDDMATRSCKHAPPEGGNEEKEMAAAERTATGSNQHVHGHGGGDNDDAGAYAEMGLDWLHKLADEMDEATQETEEVLRIKAILDNHHEQTAEVLFESLRRLQLMQLTVDKLKSTEIGAAVAALKKHKSRKIRTLVQDIAMGWKVWSDEWVAATKVAMAGDSNKSLGKANSSAAEDGGLAIPPMDVGALFMSQATAIQHMSEFLDGIDDDGGILNNHIITSMDKDGGSSAGVERKCKDPRPSDTVAGTKPPIIVQALPETTQGSLFKKRKPQKRRCGIGKSLVLHHQGLEGRAKQPSQRNPDRLNGDETTVHKTQVILPTRQEAVFLATNLRKPQESGRRCSRVVIKYNKPSSTEGEPRSLSKGCPEKTRHEDLRPRQNKGEVSVTGNPSVAAARKPPSDGHVIKTGTSAQSLQGPKFGLGKRHISFTRYGIGQYQAEAT